MSSQDDNRSMPFNYLVSKDLQSEQNWSRNGLPNRKCNKQRQVHIRNLDVKGNGVRIMVRG